MVDLKNDKESIVNFIKNSLYDFKTTYGNPKAVGIFCQPLEGLLSISINREVEILEKNKNKVEFEYQNFDTLFVENWKIESQKDISKWKYWGTGISEISGAQKIYNINKVFYNCLWTIIREATSEIYLPTTLLFFEFPELNDIIIHSNLEKFGRTVTKLFRNDIFEGYLSTKNHYRSIDIEAYKKSYNPNGDDETRNLTFEIATFYSSLTSEQAQTLDKIMLGNIDNVAFNVMSGLDGNNKEETGISLTIDNLDVRDLPLIGNGNLSGEYFDWVERFSKYGGFQH